LRNSNTAIGQTVPWDPEKGLLYNKKNNLLDPYARAVTGQTSWGMKNSQPGDYHARVVRNNYDWKESHFPKISMEDSVIYEMHVRGFTKSRTSGVKYPGTFAGIIEKIPISEGTRHYGGRADAYFRIRRDPEQPDECGWQ
jgi:pullulanase/glycogen debranching enzyme